MNKQIKFKVFDKTLNEFIDFDCIGKVNFNDETYEFLQFIGLQDAYGTEIYEGDLLLESGYDYPLEVIRQPSGLWIADSKKGYFDLALNIASKSIIIGNVFEKGTKIEIKEPEILVYES